MVITPFILSFFLSVVSIPIVRRLSFRTDKIVFPREDRWNSRPTPTLGGVAMFFAFIGTILLYSLINQDWGWIKLHWSLVVTSIMMFGLGLVDDFKRISPPKKLAGQIIAAVIVVFFGRYIIDFFPWPVANIILTIFWLVGITNAINLLDNMDGLAGGVALIASIVLSFFFGSGSEYFLLVLSLSLCGSILGFLIFNFPPAKIFMGDSGSMFLGFTLAALSIARRTQASNIFAVVGVPTLIFLLPIIDTTLVTITRVLRGQSPTQGGTDHTSHRLIAFGLSERQAVIVLYGIALMSGLAAAGLEALDYDLSLVLIPVLLIGLTLFAAYLARLKVVPNPTNNQGAMTRFIVSMAYQRRLFEMLFDLMLIGTSYYLAYWTRYGLDMTIESMGLFLRSWPMILLSAYFSFFIFRVYRGVWRYVGISDLVRYIGAVFVSALLGYITVKIIYPQQSYTLDVFFLYAIFLFLGLAGSRSSFRIFDRIYSRAYKSSEHANILIYGADDTGEIALRWILRNRELGWTPVAFLDEDTLMKGQYIHGVQVMGGVENLGEVLRMRNIDGMVVTTNSFLNSPAGVKLVQTCRDQGVWIRVLHLEFEPIE